jgi:hypothetical protein
MRLIDLPYHREAKKQQRKRVQNAETLSEQSG